jgi:ribosome recycling factor
MLENSDKNLQLKREGKIITCVLQGGSTKEMKDGLVKQVKQQVDKAKDKIRDIRSEGVDMVKF